MRSGTSCFNGTLYRKTMARFWPLWALYGLFWMFAIPLNLMNRYFNYLRWTGGTGTPQDLLLDLAQSIPEYLAPGVWLAALCAAPILLGRWGLLDGRKATSYPTRHSQLGKAEVLPEARAVSDGKFVTGHACGSAFDFGLKLVEVLRGEEAARAVNDVIYYRR